MVKIVTDSSADVPDEVARELGITVIPLYIRFGNEVYRDGLDISADQFYQRLRHGNVRPRTSTPSPGDFAKIYNHLAAETDGIVSVHLANRYSGALNVARLARDYVTKGCQVQVIDSKSVSMGCGLVAIAAARKARDGASLEQVTRTANRAIWRTRIVGMIADINYLLGGRRLALPTSHRLLGKLGTWLHFKLVGEVYEAGMVRGRGIYLKEAKALEKLEECIAELQPIAELAVLQAGRADWAQKITERLTRLPTKRLYQGRLGGTTGAHSGPGAVAVAFISEVEGSPSGENHP